MGPTNHRHFTFDDRRATFSVSPFLVKCIMRPLLLYATVPERLQISSVPCSICILIYRIEASEPNAAA